MIKAITHYITSDGTIFDDEKEAEKYELRNLSNDLTSDDLLIIDHYGRIYSPSTELSKGVELATVMNIKTEKGLDAIRKIAGALETLIPESLGIFRYDNEEWIDLKDEIDILNYKWQGVVDIGYEEK